MKDTLDADRPDPDRPYSSDADSGSGRTHLGLDRRHLLKIAGIGAATSVLGTGAVLAKGNGYGPAQGTSIHPFLGYTELPDSIDPTSFPKKPDHEVLSMIHLPPEETCGPFHFDPVGLHVEPGEVVHWVAETDWSLENGNPTGYIAGDHTITAYSPVVSRQQRIPEGATPFSSPMIGVDVSWYYEFETPGVYDMYCGPHEDLGMVMRIVVGDVTDTSNFGDGYDPNSPPGPDNPPLFDQVKPLGAAPDVLANLDPQTILDDGKIEWDESLCTAPT